MDKVCSNTKCEESEFEQRFTGRGFDTYMTFLYPTDNDKCAVCGADTVTFSEMESNLGEAYAEQRYADFHQG